MSTLLILTVLVATILAGCGGVGSEGSSQAPKEQQASRTADYTELKAKNLPDKRLKDDSGTPGSGMPMRLWF